METWQEVLRKNSIASLEALSEKFGAENFPELDRLRIAADNFEFRISPAMVDLIKEPNDPIWRQYVPTVEELDVVDGIVDSLNEDADSPVPNITHRYPDRALFLVSPVCASYCRFCTRSYAVGVDTAEVQKVSLKTTDERWQKIFAYVASRPELEDIVVSGGDSYNLRASQIRQIGETLLAMPNILRIRFATKGPAVMPQKLLSDDDWFGELAWVVEEGRRRHKEVVLHTHFNHPAEATGFSQDAARLLHERGIYVRNQSVLQLGVNDTAATQILLARRLSYLNVHPYYVYVHDLVKGVENLRTTVATAIRLEKRLRGSQAGFNTPTFVVDAPGGGGKRDCHSYEHYNRTTGVSVYTAPSVKAGQYYAYFDPIHLLPEEGRRRWADPKEHGKMIQEALDAARARGR